MELDLLTNRRREVMAEIARLKARMAAMETELAELDTAGKVIARLSGATWPPTGQGNESQPPSPASREPKRPMTAMIHAILEDAQKEGLDGLEPKNIARWVGEAFHFKPKGEYVSSIVWRMWQRGQVQKKGSLYYLGPRPPETPEAAAPSSQTAAASDLANPPAKGREAGPGGGT
jgi:hypothetical protein